MAWQNSTAMGGNGGVSGGISGGSGEGGNNGGQPQGTEYTLQGADDAITFYCSMNRFVGNLHKLLIIPS